MLLRKAIYQFRLPPNDIKSQQAIARSFNVTIYTEYESAIALSEVAVSELTPAFINILDSACYAVFQK